MKREDMNEHAEIGYNVVRETFASLLWASLLPTWEELGRTPYGAITKEMWRAVALAIVEHEYRKAEEVARDARARRRA